MFSTVQVHYITVQCSVHYNTDTIDQLEPEGLDEFELYKRNVT